MIKKIFTAKEIRDRSPAWRRFLDNADRKLLNIKIREAQRQGRQLRIFK